MMARSVRRTAHQLEREKARQALGLPTDSTVSDLHAVKFTLVQATRVDLEAEADAIIATLTRLAAELNFPWSLEHFKTAFLYDQGYRPALVVLVLDWLDPLPWTAHDGTFRLLEHASYRSRPSKIPGGSGRLVHESHVNLVIEAVKLLGGEEKACEVAKVTRESIHKWIADGWRRSKAAQRFIALSGIEANTFNSLVVF